MAKFKKGQSGNPKGRPVGTTGSISITGLIKAELVKCPEGEKKKTYADLIIKRILSKAIKEGDTKMIGKIWSYIDGMPKQAMDISGELKNEVELSNGQFNQLIKIATGEKKRSNSKETS